MSVLKYQESSNLILNFKPKNLRLYRPSRMLPFQSFCLSFSAFIVNCRGLINFPIVILLKNDECQRFVTFKFDAFSVNAWTDKALHVKLGSK